MIHLTFVSENVRGSRQAYDTDHAGEALTEAVARWYASGDEHPRETVVFCVVVERDAHELSRAQVAEKVEEIGRMERTRALFEERT